MGTKEENENSILKPLFSSLIFLPSFKNSFMSSCVSVGIPIIEYILSPLSPFSREILTAFKICSSFRFLLIYFLNLSLAASIAIVECFCPPLTRVCTICGETASVLKDEIPSSIFTPLSILSSMYFIIASKSGCALICAPRSAILFVY